MEHILLHCQQLHDIRQVLASWGITLPVFASLHDCLASLFGTQEDFCIQNQLYCLIIYHSWKRRNAFIHHQSHATPSILAATALASFSSTTRSPILKQWDVTSPSQVDQNRVWRPPPAGWLKANVDGALLSNYSGGIGVVIRDEWGKLIRCYGRPVEHWDAAQVEIMAIQALHCCCYPKELAATGIIIEGDCRNVLLKLQHCFLTKDWSTLLHLAPTMDFLLSFNAVLFNFVPRECNRLAHLCAHAAITCLSSFCWDLIPDAHAPILAVLQDEMRPLVP